MMDPRKKETIIQKCFGITGWTTRRGRLSLQGEEQAIRKVDNILNKLVQDLVEFIRDEQ
uniref:Uncharacterized protein n=1 Tax=viral metagenome TaxID=1070528 RepID=A0A6M3LGF6_9ZZZZ